MVEAAGVVVEEPQPERFDSAEEQKTRPAAQIDEMLEGTKTLTESNKITLTQKDSIAVH